MKRNLILFLTFFFTMSHAQSIYYEVVKIQNDFFQTQNRELYLKHWDTLFYNSNVFPLDKSRFLNNRATVLDIDTLIKRTKFLAYSKGYIPCKSCNDYRKITESDSINGTSYLAEIDSLAKLYHINLPKDKQDINSRLQRLWVQEDYYFQRRYKDDPQKNISEENRDSALSALLDEYLDICRIQGCVPNSFDNNLADQAHYLLVFRHLVLSVHQTDTLRLRIWDDNLQYFITAYQSGKIMNEFCWQYDVFSKAASGMQYFGTLIDVPIKDLEMFEQRKKEFDIDNLISILRSGQRR